LLLRVEECLAESGCKSIHVFLIEQRVVIPSHQVLPDSGTRQALQRNQCLGT
jgi:hypothetical protein